MIMVMMTTMMILIRDQDHRHLIIGVIGNFFSLAAIYLLLLLLVDSSPLVKPLQLWRARAPDRSLTIVGSK